MRTRMVEKRASLGFGREAPCEEEWLGICIESSGVSRPSGYTPSRVPPQSLDEGLIEESEWLK